MALFKRGKWWWTDFSVNGVRYRVSLDTTDWREAQRLEKEKITLASEGKLEVGSRQFGRMAFTVAADVYVEQRQPQLASRSIQTEKERLKPLKAYFGLTTLNRISADSVRQYIVERKTAKLSNRTVNMEVACLARILRRAKRWHLIADELKPLPERHDVGRALSFEEKTRLLRMAEAKPEWDTARFAAMLALNTTMRGCELKGLTWRDVDFMERTITIRRSKTAAGERVIPLNGEALAVILALREKARKLFGDNLEADWYVFPHGEGYSKPDPTKPMSGWRSAWRSLTRAIHCPACGQLQRPAKVCVNDECKADLSKVKSPLHGLRFHDLRHHAITELAEGQASDGTIRAIAGHVSNRMLEHYSYIRMDAKRTALEALGNRGLKGGYDTNRDTNSQAEQTPVTQLTGNNGGQCRARTCDLLLVRQAL